MTKVVRLLAVMLAGVLLPPSAGCRQPWRFFRPNDPLHHTRAGLAAQVPPAPPPAAPAGLGGSARAAGLEGTAPYGVSFEGSLAAPGGAFFDGSAEPAPLWPDRRPPAALADGRRQVSDPPRPFRPAQAGWRGMVYQTAHHVRADYGNYYDWITTRDLLLGIAAGSVLANTSMDQGFRDWYQDDVRCRGTDSFVSFWEPFGRAEIFVPAFAGLGLVGGLLEDRPLAGETGEFGDRVTRAYLVGTPPMVFMQFCLGASRPEEADVESRWKPFDDGNGVSGHTFVGAVPFVTAARMVEAPWAKGCLYLCSTFTAWSRVNDDAHYLSQAWLGWWMAYLACRSVDRTARQEPFRFTPLAAPDAAGLGVVLSR